jgi:hypothetical protein
MQQWVLTPTTQGLWKKKKNENLGHTIDLACKYGFSYTNLADIDIGENFFPGPSLLLRVC